MLSYGSAFWPEFWAIIGGGAALTVAVLTLASIVIRRWQQPAPAIAVPAPATTAPATTAPATTAPATTAPATTAPATTGRTDVTGDLPAAA